MSAKNSTARTKRPAGRAGRGFQSLPQKPEAALVLATGLSSGVFKGEDSPFVYSARRLWSPGDVRLIEPATTGLHTGGDADEAGLIPALNLHGAS